MTLPSNINELLAELKSYSNSELRPSTILSKLKKLQADSTMIDDEETDLGVAEDTETASEEMATAEDDSSALQELVYAWGLLQAYEKKTMEGLDDVCNRLSESIYDVGTAIINGDLHNIAWFANELRPMDFKIEIAKVLVRQLKLYKVPNNLDLFERIVDEDPYILNQIRFKLPE